MSALPTQKAVVDATREANSTMEPQSVPINVYEAPEALVVVAPFVAVQPEDVTVEVSGHTLRMIADLRTAAPRDYLVEEWGYGGYQRDVEIPDGYGSGVEASLANGQLAVRVLRGEPGEVDIRIRPTATALSALS
ncbi:MAG: Hsp20/alpha crystallin family protein [Microthrixaceae bacterium]